MARKEFAEDYGSFIELMYLITRGDFLKMKQVDDWKTVQFLFLGEYLLRKKNVENMK